MRSSQLAILAGLLTSGTAFAACPGDINGNGVVDVQDILEVFAGWGNPYTIEDLLIVIGDWGCVSPADVDRVGLFNPSTNYFDLSVETQTLQFHFGSQMSRWAAGSYATAGDFDGDGADTVAVVDFGDSSFLLADENDSDEFEVLGTKVYLTGVPPLPPQGDGPPVQFPVVGDWDGDGVDGFGFFHTEASTFYLRDALTTGPPSRTVFLDPAAGYPSQASPLVGDFDGDGDVEVGLFKAGVVYLATDLDDLALAMSFSVPGGVALAGDFNGNGTDTIAVLNESNNEFTILESNSEGAPTTTVQFGYAEPGFWHWVPLAGNWQVPTNPVASRGFEWAVGDPDEHGMNGAALSAALDNTGIDNIQAVLVIRHGELLAERYYHGYDRHIAQNVKSVSKSVLSGIIGVAYDQGHISGLGDTVATYLPTYFQGLSEPKQQITIQDMMTMRGGLFNGPTTPEYNSALIASPDYTQFVLEQKLVSTPGTVFSYSTGLSHLGSAMLTEAVGMSSREFARQHVFGPIGISTPRWDGSPEGYDFGGAEMWMRPRDLARFGQLFIQSGLIDDQQVISQLWVTESANPWVPEAAGRLYGLWWRERPWASYNFTDSYFAWGHGGQFLFIYPNWELIVVVNSKWQVSYQQAGQIANQIFGFVDQSILTTVTD